jgi:2-C-methyl-D-erythritol 4-phosphate cytidylyltransferase
MRTFIITAGGIGKRMGGNTPKQFLMLKGTPVLMHTIHALHAYDSQAELIVTLPKEHLSDWTDLCEKQQFTVPHTVIEGGTERFHSVQNALARATGEVIAIHDGVRPFVSKETLNRLFDKAKIAKAVIPVLAVKESMRKVDADTNQAVNRSEYVLVQTPQVFQSDLVKSAYQQPYSANFTDDASVVEATGVSIALVPGNEENIKLTNPTDLLIAQTFLNK